MYIIMFGNDENLYHEGPFKTWEDAEKFLKNDTRSRQPALRKNGWICAAWAMAPIRCT